MLLHLKWLVDQNHNASSATPTALYLDLREAEARKQIQFRRWPNPTPILLLDNCDCLLNDNGVGRLREFTKNKTLAQAIVWAGARAWHDMVLEQVETANLQPAPLAVLLPSEAEELLKPYLAPNQITSALAAGGTHPYVLKAIAHALKSLSGDPGKAIQTVAERLTPLFQACRAGLRKPDEQTLLHYLVKEARPINPQEAAKTVGLPTIKPSADVLCALGLISRWNLNEGAVLQANCRTLQRLVSGYRALVDIPHKHRGRCATGVQLILQVPLKPDRTYKGGPHCFCLLIPMIRGKDEDAIRWNHDPCRRWQCMPSFAVSRRRRPGCPPPRG